MNIALRRALFVALAAAMGGAGVVAAVLVADAVNAPPAPSLNLRARPPDAPGGAAFLEHLRDVPADARQGEILREILRGNVPPFERRLKPVRLSGTTPAGRSVTATVWVMPDYMAIGSDSDFVRVPLDLPTAFAVARALDLRLPTAKIVDAVYRQASVHLEPIPMTPGPRMRSAEYVLSHNRQIERARAGHRLGDLTAGQKKDLVLTRRLRQRPGRVAIYGWHRLDGSPIQPLSTVHGSWYADYSHGVRFVAPTVTVDGREREYFDVLADGLLGPVLSYEGGIRDGRALQGSPGREEMGGRRHDLGSSP